jgi:dTDP-4-dehydrorhamnose 3,5-epimerase
MDPIDLGQNKRTNILKFHETPLKGAYTIELDKIGDDRGLFAQINNSLTGKQGTLRGMHYQLTPSAEVKVVRCISGSLYDVILDIRPDSPTFGQWFGKMLSSENRTMMYVPKGFAHGFLTLEPDTEAFYLVSDPYAPDLERGIRFDDPKFGIEWPSKPVEISEKDKNWPDFDPVWHGTDLLKGMV